MALLERDYDGEIWKVIPAEGLDKDRMEWAIIRREEEDGAEELDTLAFAATRETAKTLADMLTRMDVEAMWLVNPAVMGEWVDVDWAVQRTDTAGKVEILAMMQTDYLAEKYILERIE